MSVISTRKNHVHHVYKTHYRSALSLNGYQTQTKVEPPVDGPDCSVYSLAKSQIPRVAIFRQPVLRFIRWCHDSIVSLSAHRKSVRRRRRAPNKKVAAGTILLGRDSRPPWLLKGQGKVTFFSKKIRRGDLFLERGRPAAPCKDSRPPPRLPKIFFIVVPWPTQPPWSADADHGGGR